MSEDFRKSLINTFQESLVGEFDSSQIEFATRKLILALNDYELSRRTTELTVYDDSNQRIVKRYLASLVIGGKSNSTVQVYGREIKKMLDVVQKNVAEIATNDLLYYLAVKKESGISNRTLGNMRSYLSSFFSWLSAEGIIEKNPCDRVTTIKCPDKIKLPYSDSEIEAIRNACASTKQRMIVEVLLSSGVRVDEFVKMEVSDIDLEKKSLIVKNGKGGKQRITYLSETAVEYIKKYLAERSEDGPLLVYNRNHEPIATNGVRVILDRVGEKAGVDKVHPHRFRRTLATKLYEAGMSIPEIQRILGHSDISTTMVYVTMADEKVEKSYREHFSA